MICCGAAAGETGKEPTPAAGPGSPHLCGIRPIHGTWVNLFHQDGRNKYTNPPDMDMFSPELWRTKVREMAELGMEYLVFLAMANEGKAAYESPSMPPIYRGGRESPVSAIMKAADECGLKVFLSCGWAINQDDRMANPPVRQGHLKIMRECAERFSAHRSFCGWYFPVEFPASPTIADASIDGVNVLAAEARRLTPKARLMISPYRVHLARVDEKYVSQLKKLDVDIIAYQDGVGCVFVSPPPVRAQFDRLRWAHDQVPKIALWGNVETFAWENKPNSRYSALVPAAFPRVLSQMAGVAKADETITWIVQGMLDKPGSRMPLGQPTRSARMAQDYLDFLGGRGRWPLLAASFTDKLTHEAAGRTVTLTDAPAPKYARGHLTDGKLGVEDLSCPQWLGFEKTRIQAVIDLGQPQAIHTLAGRFLQYLPAGIQLPTRVEFCLSDDGRTFEPGASIEVPAWPHDRHDYWIDIALAAGLKLQGRYVRMRAVGSGQWLFVDEVMVNPKIK